MLITVWYMVYKRAAI